VIHSFVRSLIRSYIHSRIHSLFAVKIIKEITRKTNGEAGTARQL